MLRSNVFDVKRSIQHFGIWYAIWHHGWENAWTIWVATRMLKREADAQREHADWHYR